MNALDKIVYKFGELLARNSHGQHAPMQVLAIDLLDSTSHIWLQASIANTEVGENIRELCGWLSRNMMKKKFVSWKVRDFASQFFVRYIAQDPSEAFWPKQHRDKPVDKPSTTIPMLNMDEDIRVRFRAAVVNARLFTLARSAGWDPLDKYDAIKGGLTKDLSK
jgi:ataxia telangiectasia mutated family protein